MTFEDFSVGLSITIGKKNKKEIGSNKKNRNA
jgi:hypothetical protein